MNDDLIRRQAAIDAICEECHMETDYHRCEGYKKDSRWCEYSTALNDLPSAQPERKKRKWVEVAVTDGYDKDGIKTLISVMQCDQCGFIVNAVEGHMAQYNYCPNCGADMRGNKQ